jgi:hypothetical protein
MIAETCTSYFWPFVLMTVSWAIAMVSLFMIRRTIRRP